MPHGMFKWEATAGIDPHCGVCHKVLSSSSARTTCIGKHVEACIKYYQNLFFIGASHTCMACRSSNETHKQRHREIVEIVQRIERLHAELEVAATPTRKKPNDNGAGSPSTTSPKQREQANKKERKAARKAAKALLRSKVFTAAEVARVAAILHPKPE
ncbi:hypothetical protein BJ546DRAFT_62872 [Cryomyces antarcticus]